MQVLSSFLVLFLALIPLRALSLSSECETALQSLFRDSVSKEKAAEFLKLQGDITLHRLAWAFLKRQHQDADKTLKSTERTIIELLNEKYTRSDPEFIRAREAFEAQPLSRATLAEVAPYLKNVLDASFPESEDIFRLNASDIKLLGVLAKHERLNAVNGKFDHRMLNEKSPRGILNFIKLINSSYKLNQTAEENDLNIENKISGLEKVLESLQKKLSLFLNQLEIPPDCQDQCVTCRQEKKMENFFSEDIQKLFWATLGEKLESDDNLLGKLTYGDLWLRVRESAPEKKVLRPTVIEEAGVLIGDPLDVILKDRPERDRASWKNFDKEFKEAMASAILADEKVFLYRGSLYERQTGREVSVTKALENLPPQEREKVYGVIQKVKPEFRKALTEAIVNRDKSFRHNDRLYDLQGEELNPAEVIVTSMSQKLGLTVLPSRYKGMGQDYLAARAHALKNNRPYFQQGKVTYDSLTGKNISSPFRSLATSDAKIDKNRRKIYEGLPDRDLIRNFRRENKDPKCQYYGVLDKKTAQLTIYHEDGKPRYAVEVLIGAEASDQRTRWTHYSDSVRTPSSSTGAGIFTIRTQNLNDTYNKKTFNNNILSFKDENNKDTVFAIHQVPIGMSSRYERFGTGDPEDRRISGGCANVKLGDFHKIKEWLGPGCRVYVLPEEEGNKFAVRDNDLRLISTRPVPMNKLNYYNFSAADSKPRAIDIKIINKEMDTQLAREFTRALEEEKSKLMEIYKLTNDEYNDLALLAFGILGNESEFGKSGRLKVKENAQFAVIAARLLKTKDLDVARNTSRGLTQIKFLPEGPFKEYYPEVTKENLMNPRNSAVATMAYLAEAAKQMRVIALRNKSDPGKLRITRENMMDYMGYLYQGRRSSLTTSDPSAQATPEFNGYYRALQRNMSYIEISQKID